MIVWYILLTVWLILGVISLLTFWRDDDFRKDDEDIFILIVITLSPINILTALTLIILALVEHMLDGIKIRKKNKEIDKERSIKIKKGIIRITPIDPYGEEDWID